MQLSRLTFSLASLILMFAFVVMPAMAHDLTPAADHPHKDAPTVESIELVDVMVGDDSTVDGMKVRLIDNLATPAIADGTSAGNFLVKITFSEPLYAAIDSTSFEEVKSGNLMVTAAAESDTSNDLYGSAGGGAVSIVGSFDNPATTDQEKNTGKVFYATVTVGMDLFGGQTGDASDLPIDVWITVNANTGYSQTGLVDGTNTYGTANAASTREKFTVVSMFDTPLSTVEISIPDTAGPAAAFDATFTFGEPAPTTFEADDITVTGGVVTEGPTQGKDDKTNVWTTTITPVVGATEVIVGVADTVATGDSVTTKPATPGTPTGDTDTFAAGTYVVVVRDMDNPPDFGTANPTLVEWAAMPDLQRLFDVGGSINVKVEGATRLQVVFSEMMWAVDEGKVGETGYSASQWIELHNRTSGANAKAFSIAGITLTSQEGRPALPEETDRISNVVGGGADWVLGKGQNGNSGAADGTGMVEFISMYRNNYGEPGHQSSRWTKSSELYTTNHRGTPGAKERSNVAVIGATNANRGPVIFNEIANYPDGNKAHEWIELRNVSGGEVNLKNWEITLVTSKGAPPQDGHNDVDFINFPNADRKMAAGSVLLITATDPSADSSHPLATGWNIAKGANDQINGVNSGSPRYIVLGFKDNGLPDNGEFVLVLRNRNDRNGSVNDNNIRDVAGHVPSAGLKVDNASLFTNLWPLQNFHPPDAVQNKFTSGTVHLRQHAGVNGTDRSRRDRGANADDGAFRDIGWTSIGYKRNAAANAQNGGTPGYPNNALQSNETQAGADPVIISEVMYATGSRANVPQWIELYNTSQTVGINLDGWRVTIVNHDQDAGDETYAGDLSKHYAISGKIPPGQTFLLVAYPGRNDTNLPAERIKTLRANRGELILSQYAFEITLLTRGKDGKDENRKVADKIGNLAPLPAGTGRVRGDAQSYEDPVWALPMGTNEEGDRISIVRVPMKDGFINGQLPGAWSKFDMSAQFVTTLDTTSYGHSTDISSPGHTVGGVLPVSLSKFRPERLKDTSEVVIRWVTESETNNAGFNILRGEKIDGEFTKLQFVAGQGTTSERTLYEWKDKTAKPNVVYYYQIQDVSLDGEVQTLRTTHLRGNVTAAGKLTTIWGELKSQD